MDDWSDLPPALQRVLHAEDKYSSAESRRKGFEFTPSSKDVILCATQKSGSTWLQQICHGLRSRGDMNFDEMTLVIPLIEMAHDVGIPDLQAPQPFEPRMFKTHFWHRDCPKGAGKYIILIREPEDAAVSYYRYLANWVFSAEDCSLERFVQLMFLTLDEPADCRDYASHFRFIASWYPHRREENVLWLHYEDLQENLQESVRLVAEFLEIGRDDAALQELVTRQASFDFMKKFASKFEENTMKAAVAQHIPDFPNGKTGKALDKIRSGKVGEGKSAISETVRAALYEKWQAVVAPVSGYQSYEGLRRGTNQELGRKFLS